MVAFKEKHLKRVAIYLIVGIFFFLLFDFFQEIKTIKRHKNEILENTAYQTFFKNLLYRRWIAMHGGVYVPVSEETPSNPYLKVENKDIYTTDSVHLTLVNPAYMTRQAFNLNKSLGSGEIEKITSLDPINPINTPDAWEQKALKIFKDSIMYYAEFDTINGKEYYRYMRALVVEESCFKCHQYQGYQLGDVRGGISVAIPMDQYKERGQRVLFAKGRSNAIVFLLVLGVVLVFYWSVHRMLKKELKLKREKDQKNDEIEQIFEHTPMSIFVVNKDLNLVNANTLGKEMIGVEDLKRNQMQIGQAIGCAYFIDSIDVNDCFKYCAKYQSGDSCELAELIKYSFVSNQNQFKNKLNFDIKVQDRIDVRNYEVSTVHLTQNEQDSVLLMVDDVTEMAKNERELKLINARLKGVESIIYYKAKSTHDLLNSALEEIINYTGSDTGAVYYYDEVKGVFILNNWSDSFSLSLPDAVKHSAKLNNLNCLTSAVKFKKPIIRNDSNEHYSFYKNGAEKGLKSLTIPIIKDGTTQAVVWVASKTKTYSDFDAQQVLLLLDAAWVLLERMDLMDKSLQ
ncbi:c-type heme family protein [Plebeiibacterium sediminum]|uniref:DUF3365 domain-containing protein n=1 Tax=Plebeiibacterium sediminum TaxID=2992112 RepID=A0AAE3SDF5_9BACT|nr:DUF3365 domain-containing protein [Plebeiobacterium sediminum]MCW3785338.1 DUF3365 domain-containing protein [Plebeiobacterium sediminum]